MTRGQLDEMLWHLAVATATLIFIVCAVFVVWYSQYDWRETELGRHWMHMTGVIGATYGLTAGFAWMDELGWRPLGPTGRLLVTNVVFITTAVLIVQRLLLSYETQKEWERAVRKAQRELSPMMSAEEVMMGHTKPQPILKWMALLAGIDVVVGGSALANFIPVDVIGFIALLLAGAKVAVAFYLRGQVVPLQDVGAYVTVTGRMAAGPAANAPDGTTVEVHDTTAKGHA